MDDAKLMAKLASGDVVAFEALVRRHQAQLCRFADSILHDHELAEDCVQEAFLRLWRFRTQYRHRGHPAAYLTRIVRNATVDIQRARLAHPEVALADVEGMTRADATKEAEDRLDSGIIRDALDDLPEQQRIVFTLSEYNGMSYQEIAEVVGCPANTIASRKFAAMEALRRKLAPILRGDKHDV